MADNISKIIDNSSVNKSDENSEPMLYSNDEIPFTTCIEIPSGFKVIDLINIKIKYIINKEHLNIVEVIDELQAEIFNNSTLLKVKAIKLLGTLDCCTIINGFAKQDDDDNTINDISFLNSSRINLNNNICYFLLQDNINYDNIKDLYKLEIKTVEAFLFTEDGRDATLLTSENDKVSEDTQEILLNNSYRKYIIIKSKIIIKQSISS